MPTDFSSSFVAAVAAELGTLVNQDPVPWPQQDLDINSLNLTLIEAGSTSLAPHAAAIFDALCIDLFEHAFFGNGNAALQREFYLLVHIACMLYLQRLVPSFDKTSPLLPALASTTSRFSTKQTGEGGETLYSYGSLFRELAEDEPGCAPLLLYFMNTLKTDSSQRLTLPDETSTEDIERSRFRNSTNGVDLKIKISMSNSNLTEALASETARRRLLRGSYFLPIFTLMLKLGHNSEELNDLSDRRINFYNDYLNVTVPSKFNPLMASIRTFARVLVKLNAGSFDTTRFVTKFSGMTFESALMTVVNMLAAQARYVFNDEITSGVWAGEDSKVFRYSYERVAGRTVVFYRYSLVTGSRNTFNPYTDLWRNARLRTFEQRSTLENGLRATLQEEKRERAAFEKIINRYEALGTRLDELAAKIEKGSDYPALKSLLTVAKNTKSIHARGVLSNISPSNPPQMRSTLSSRVSTVQSMEAPLASRAGSSLDSAIMETELSSTPGSTIGADGGTATRLLAFASLCMTNRFVNNSERNVVLSIGLPNRFLETLTQRSVRFNAGQQKPGYSSKDTDAFRKLTKRSMAYGVYAPMVILKRDERVPRTDYVHLASPIMMPVNLRLRRLVRKDYSNVATSDPSQVLSYHFGGKRPTNINKVVEEAFSSVLLDMIDLRTGAVIKQIEYTELLESIKTSSTLDQLSVSIPYIEPKTEPMKDALKAGLERFLESEFLSYGIEMMSGLDMRDVSMLAGDVGPRIASYPVGTSSFVARVLDKSGMLDYLGATTEDVIGMFESTTLFGKAMETLVSSELRAENVARRSLSLVVQSLLTYATQYRDRFAAVAPKVYDVSFHLNIDMLDFGQRAISNQRFLGDQTQQSVFVKPGDDQSLIRYAKSSTVNRYLMDEYWVYFDLEQLFVG